jgi:hypothetical protein
MSAAVEVSVVLPAYNEEATITDAVERTLATLEGFLPGGRFEVFFSEVGCTYRTPALAPRPLRLRRLGFMTGPLVFCRGPPPCSGCL